MLLSYRDWSLSLLKITPATNLNKSTLFSSHLTCYRIRQQVLTFQSLQYKIEHGHELAYWNWLHENTLQFSYAFVLYSWPSGESCSDGWVIRMWVRILAMTMVLVFISKTLHCTMLLFTQEYKMGTCEGTGWYRVWRKPHYGCLGCTLPREQRKITVMTLAQ